MHARIQREAQLSLRMFVIVLVFVGCYLPALAVFAASFVSNDNALVTNVPFDVIVATGVLMVIPRSTPACHSSHAKRFNASLLPRVQNAMIDPFLFVFMDARVRDQFVGHLRRVLRACRCCECALRRLAAWLPETPHGHPQLDDHHRALSGHLPPGELLHADTHYLTSMGVGTAAVVANAISMAGLAGFVVTGNAKTAALASHRSNGSTGGGIGGGTATNTPGLGVSSSSHNNGVASGRSGATPAAGSTGADSVRGGPLFMPAPARVLSDGHGHGSVKAVPLGVRSPAQPQRSPHVHSYYHHEKRSSAIVLGPAPPAAPRRHNTASLELPSRSNTGVLAPDSPASTLAASDGEPPFPAASVSTTAAASSPDNAASSSLSSRPAALVSSSAGSAVVSLPPLKLPARPGAASLPFAISEHSPHSTSHTDATLVVSLNGGVGVGGGEPSPHGDRTVLREVPAGGGAGGAGAGLSPSHRLPPILPGERILPLQAGSQIVVVGGAGAGVGVGTEFAGVIPGSAA